MRVSVGIHKEDVDAAIQTYHMMSRKLFTHATPTLFNSGTPRPQMSSCFLLTMKEDSIEVRRIATSNRPLESAPNLPPNRAVYPPFAPPAIRPCAHAACAVVPGGPVGTGHL